MPAIRLLLVDDSPTFLAAIREFLAAYQWVSVVGASTSGAAALDLLDQLRPDLVLVDLAMPELNGLETTRRIKDRTAAPRVVIMTLYDIVEYQEAAQAAAADGFVTKSSIGTRLLPTIRALFDDRQPQHGASPN